MTAGTVRILAGVALVMALMAVVLFFIPSGTKRAPPEGMGGGAAAWNPSVPMYESRVRTHPGRPFGVVLIGIYDVVFGSTALSLGLGGALMGELLGELPTFIVPADAPLAVTLLSLALAGFGAVVLATAYGVWSVQAWGHRLQAAPSTSSPAATTASSPSRPWPTSRVLRSLTGVASIRTSGAGTWRWRPNER